MAPLPRPLLVPGLVRFPRSPHVLQLGLHPAHAVLVELADPRTARVLDLLDGSRTERAVLALAAAAGAPAADTRALLDALRGAGLLVDAAALLPAALAEDARGRLAGEAAALALRDRPAPAAPGRAAPASPARTLRRRAAARVVVAGAGRLGPAVALALAQAGVGHVHADLPGTVTRPDLPGGPFTPDDLGRPRAAALAAALDRAAPGVAVHPVRRGTATAVVQQGHDQPVALLAAGYARRAQPHLAVTVREGAAVVGPFVTTAHGPCLNCLDLHRRDRDPGWPALAARLSGPAGAPAAEPIGVTTLLAAAGYAAAQVLALVDGAVPDTVGAAVEIAAPGRHRRRRWPPHPGCCGRPRSRAPRRAPAPPDPGDDRP